MVFRRSKRAKRARAPRRKYRRFNMTRRKRPGPSGFLRTVRWSNRDSVNFCHNTNYGSDTVPSTQGSCTFQLSDLTTYTDFTNLFDQFKLVKVLYRWVITRDSDWATTSTYRGYSVRIQWYHDFNDSTPPNVTDLMQRANCRELYMNGDDKPASRWYSLNPAVLSVGYESTVASAYIPKWRQYIDSESYATPHYGIKWYVSNLYAGLSLRLEAKEIYEFKVVV